MEFSLLINLSELLLLLLLLLLLSPHTDLLYSQTYNLCVGSEVSLVAWVT